MVRTHSIFAKSNFYSSALGLYAHCGNSYGGKNDSEVQKVRDDTIAEINEVAQHLIKNGVPVRHQGTFFKNAQRAASRPLRSPAGKTSDHMLLFVGMKRDHIHVIP